MVCPRCNLQLNDAANVCPRCGTRIYHVPGHLGAPRVESARPQAVEEPPASAQDAADEGAVDAPLREREPAAARHAAPVHAHHQAAPAPTEVPATVPDSTPPVRKHGMRGVIAGIVVVLVAVVCGLYATGHLPGLPAQTQEGEPAATALGNPSEQAGEPAVDTADEPETEHAPEPEQAEEAAASGAKDGTDAGDTADTWDEAHIDRLGASITVQAVCELRGWQLKTLLEHLGYAFDTSQGAYVGVGVNSYRVMGETTLLSEEELSALDRGMRGEALVAVISVGGYVDAADVLDGVCKATVVDRIDSEDGQALAAVVEDSRGEQRLMTISPNETGDGDDVLVVGADAIASGLYQSLTEVEGTTLGEVWQAIAGRQIGETPGAEQPSED